MAARGANGTRKAISTVATAVVVRVGDFVFFGGSGLLYFGGVGRFFKEKKNNK